MNMSKNVMTLTTPSDVEIVMTREFDAPRDLVFEVWTKPEHIKRWWGCHGSTSVSVEIDMRPGGAYRYVMTDMNGVAHPIIGVFREVSPPERLVHTQTYDVHPYSDYEALVTTEFQDLGGRTRIVLTVRHEAKEMRDGHLASGMEHGAAAGFDEIDVMLRELQGEAK